MKNVRLGLCAAPLGLLGCLVETTSDHWVLGLGVGIRVNDKANQRDKTGLQGRDGLLAWPGKPAGRSDLCPKGDLVGQTACNLFLERALARGKEERLKLEGPRWFEMSFPGLYRAIAWGQEDSPFCLSVPGLEQAGTSREGLFSGAVTAHSLS